MEETLRADSAPETSSHGAPGEAPDTHARGWRATTARARILAARAERKVLDRFSDVEARQLNSLRRAYRGTKGPDVLVFGDSAMFWTAPDEPDPRRLYQMVADELGRDTRVKVLYGPGYHARIVMAFLAALEQCASRPRIVVVPTSIMMTTRGWLQHPEFSYEHASADLLTAIADGSKPRRLARTPTDVADAYDRTPAPSLFGEERTYGELRMLIHGQAQTPWQKAVRRRNRIDFYNGERLEADSPGVALVRDLGRTLVRMGLPSVAYLLPVNRDDIASEGGQAALDHVAHNADVIVTAYSDAVGDTGRIVNAVFDAPGEEFIDPLHLGSAGRRRLANRIVAAVVAQLDSQGA